MPLIQEALSRPYAVGGEEYPLDGLLFYHKEMIYIRRITPLVVWLRPYMVPEMLEVPIHESFLKFPQFYTNAAERIQYCEEVSLGKFKKGHDIKNKMLKEGKEQETVSLCFVYINLVRMKCWIL